MPRIDNAALDKLGWKLGVQAYTFREMSLEDTLDMLVPSMLLQPLLTLPGLDLGLVVTLHRNAR